jgi:hypothetical protein
VSADGLLLTAAWFPWGEPPEEEKGKPALGEPETTTWANFASVFWHRREGEKNGINFVPALFNPWHDGKMVRRVKAGVIARTAIAIDIETKNGNVPPEPAVVVKRLAELGLAGVVYTSHNHDPVSDIRFRVVVPVEQEIAPDVPAPLYLAELLDLADVLDRSKIGAASLFYLPSCPPDAGDLHECHVVQGAAVDAAWIRSKETERQAEEERIAAEAHAAAAERLEGRRATGFSPDDSLIEKLRQRLDLQSLLTSHGYDKSGTGKTARYRHANSRSGMFGADIKTFGGVERIYSHNAGDPLHHSNLPAWCGVTAIDAVDVVTILDFAGDRPRALHELAKQFGIIKPDERRTLAKLIFLLVDQQAPQAAIEHSAFKEGLSLGLSHAEVIDVAQWCAAQLAKEAA